MADINKKKNEINPLDVGTDLSGLNPLAQQNIVQPTAQAVNPTNTGGKIANTGNENQYTNPLDAGTSLAAPNPATMQKVNQITPQTQPSYFQQGLGTVVSGINTLGGLASQAVNPIQDIAALVNPNAPKGPILNALTTVANTPKIFNAAGEAIAYNPALEEAGRKLVQPTPIKKGGIQKAADAATQGTSTQGLTQEQVNQMYGKGYQGYTDQYLAELEKLGQLQFTPKGYNINTNSQTFNPQQIDQNMLNALGVKGTQIDNATLQTLLQNQMQGNTKNLQGTTQELDNMFNYIQDLRTNANSLIADSKNKGIEQSILDFARAGKMLKTANQMQDQYGRIFGADRANYQAQQNKLQEQLATSEQRKQELNAAFAKDLAGRNLASQNMVELNKQQADQRLKELGIELQAKETDAQNRLSEKAFEFKEKQKEEAIKAKAPDKLLQNQLVDAQLNYVNAQQVLTNPNSTPEQRSSATATLAQSQNAIASIMPLMPKKGKEEKPETKISIDDKTGRATVVTLDPQGNPKIQEIFPKSVLQQQLVDLYAQLKDESDPNVQKQINNQILNVNNLISQQK